MRIELTGYSTIDTAPPTGTLRKPGAPLLVPKTERLVFYMTLVDANKVPVAIDDPPIMYFHDHAGIKYKQLAATIPTGAVPDNLWLFALNANTIADAHSYSVVIVDAQGAFHEVINPTSLRIR